MIQKIYDNEKSYKREWDCFCERRNGARYTHTCQFVTACIVASPHAFSLCLLLLSFPRFTIIFLHIEKFDLQPVSLAHNGDRYRTGQGKVKGEVCDGAHYLKSCPFKWKFLDSLHYDSNNCSIPIFQPSTHLSTTAFVDFLGCSILILDRSRSPS
jgi:hypothetical protein